MKLTVQLFGVLEVKLDGQPVTGLRTDKVRALLTYLLIERAHPHPREALAELLWPDQAPEAALHNLRQALSTLRKALGGDGTGELGTPFLLFQGDMVAWNPAAETWVDVLAFTEACAAAQQFHKRNAGLAGLNLRRLRRALSYYRWPFLAHFSLGDSSGFEEWAMLTREALNRQAVEAMDALVEYHERRGEYSQAREMATRLLELAPWDETAHGEVMRLLALEGQWSAVQAQYAACRRYLKNELGLEPSAETQALFERIRQGAGQNKPPEPRYPTGQHNLPGGLTPFTGRQNELDELADRLAKPDCRLITLLGPGGIGKTRLALEAAREQAGLHTRGVFFIPLSGVSHCEQIPAAIAEGLGLPGSEREYPRTRLIQALSGQTILLTLDNLEHLTDGIDCLSALLAAAPGVKILATSRTRLNLQEEWVYRVDGLAYPDGTPRQPLEDYSAIQLFMQTLERTQQRAALTPADFEALIEICQLVEGSPLSLELAASAHRARGLGEIAAELRQNIDVLATSLVNVTARHRSLRATLNYSWMLLDPEEQIGLARLSVFRGGFETEAGQAVAEILPDVLARLHDHLLLRRDERGRWGLHESVRQYAAEKRVMDEQSDREVCNRHSRFFAEYVHQRTGQLETLDQGEALNAIAANHENIVAGWENAIANRQLARLDQYLRGLYLFYDFRSRYHDGAALLGRALKQLAGEPQAAPLYGRMLARLGIMQSRLSQNDEALVTLTDALHQLADTDQPDEQAICMVWLANLIRKRKSQAEAGELARQALEISRKIDYQPGIARALYMLGVSQNAQGDWQAAAELFGESVQIARRLQNPRLLMPPLNMLADTACSEGDFEQAAQLYTECQEIARRLGDQYNLAMQYNNLGTVHHYRGDYAVAINLYEESLAICTKIGDRDGQAIALSNLGEAAAASGNVSQAEAFYQQGLALARQTQDTWSITTCLINLGQAQTQLGQMRSARGLLMDGLRYAQTSQLAAKVLLAALALAQWLEKNDQTNKAAELAKAVRHHPVCEDDQSRAADEILARCAPPEVSAAKDLEELVQQILTGDYLAG